MSDLQRRFENHGGSPLMADLDIRVEFEADEAGAERPFVRVDIDRRHLRSYNIAHGGVLCTVLDTALGATAYAAHFERLQADDSGETADAELVTSQLTIHFLRPAWNGESLVGRGEIVHHGRQTIVVRGEVQTTDGVPVAAGSATFMPITIPPAAE